MIINLILNCFNLIQVFEEAMTNTQGEDLAQILWQKSPSSEVQ